MKKIVVPLLILSIVSCKKEEKSSINYRQEMRNFVQEISFYARNISPGFIIIPQNGHQLLTSDGKPGGLIVPDYIQAIDGIGREDLFYGYDNDDELTSAGAREEMIPFMNAANANGLKVLVTDYCSSPIKIADSYNENSTRGYVSFAADHRELNNIPAFPSLPYNVDTISILTLSNAKNFLYLINTELFTSKQNFVNAVAATDYDVIIMDLNFNDEVFNSSEINILKHKANGGLRKVICYMSIGEAEDYRYYWQHFWTALPPDFIVAENAQWAGNYKVKYWDKDWQSIIYGNSNSYTNRIINAGFDGVYLDIVDGFEYFEN